MKKKNKITTKEFDLIADSGSDKIDSYLDWENASRPGLESKRINMDFPLWMVNKLDQQARYRGISRQAYIKTIIFNGINN